MKTPLALLLIVAFVLLAVLTILPAKASAALRERRLAPKSPLDLEAMLYAIRQVESGDNPAAVGRHGERSAYQFTATTWHNYAHAPFLVATTNPHAADLIAHRHLQYLIQRLQDCGWPIEPAFLAAGWRYGPEAALREVRSDYARRALNLYDDFKAARVSTVQAIQEETP